MSPEVEASTIHVCVPAEDKVMLKDQLGLVVAVDWKAQGGWEAIRRQFRHKWLR